MSEFDLDALVEEAMVVGELSAGTSTTWLVGQTDARLVAVLGNQVQKKRPSKPAQWTREEDEFLRQNLGWMSTEEIARHLRRSAVAVELRWKRELQLCPPSQRPDWPNAHEVARRLGIRGDNKTVRLWMERGLLPFRKLALGADVYVTPWRAVVKFVLTPEHWMKFRAERIQHRALRELVLLRQEQWGDEWWTPGQVAAYHGVAHTDVQRYVQAGKLPAVRWGNWWVRRSDATNPKVKFFKGKGSNHLLAWSPETDGFLLLARAVGLPYSRIGQMAGWHGDARAEFRVKALMKKGRVEEVAGRLGLTIQHDARRRRLWANWRDYRERLPGLARAIGRFLDGRARSEDATTVNGVLYAWAAWFAESKAEQARAEQWKFGANPGRSKGRAETVWERYRELLSWGIDPLS